jgi:four helix bundle protein
MSYKNLEIWLLSNELAVEIHEITLLLPSHELYEIGSQIRRSSKSVKSNIVEGYGRRKYKADFIKFLMYALASNDETADHLETLFLTKSLKDEILFNAIKEKNILLGKKLNKFLSAVQKKHNVFQ